MFASLVARIAEGARAAEDLRNAVGEPKTAEHDGAKPKAAEHDGAKPKAAEADGAEPAEPGPSVPPTGMPCETDFFHSICLDMHVLTGYLQLDAANANNVAAIVKDWGSRVVVEGASQAFERDLETEISGGKVPRRTKRNTQTVERIGPQAVVAMRHEDYTTATNIRHSNFRNSFTVRKTFGPPKGPTVKFFINGRFQAAGWKTVAECEAFIDDVAGLVGLPPVDRARHAVSLVNGSARIKRAGSAPLVLKTLRDALVARGHDAAWNPTSGNNGMKVKFVDAPALEAALAEHVGPATAALRTVMSDEAPAVVSRLFSEYARTRDYARAVDGLDRIARKAAAHEMKKVEDAVSKARKQWERSAMVFSNGYVKVFSTGEPQLARLFPILEAILRDVMPE